jgi:membrane fusion protein
MDGSGVNEDGAVSLFRSEALQAARDRLGAPVRPVGVASWALAAFMASLLVATVIFLCIAKYARRETVTGMLQPAAGALRITSLRPGIVAAVNVREGQDVSRGQPLIVLAFDPTVSGGRRLGDILSDASADQGVALARQAVARRDLIDRQRDEIAAKRGALLDQQQRLVTDAALQQERVNLAEQTAQAARTLWSKQLMSAVQYRQREEALIVARQGLASIQRDQAAIPSSLAQLIAEDRRLVAEAADGAASIAANRAQLDEKRATNQAETQIVLTAQTAGQIAALQAKPGAAVSAGQALAYVLPRGVKLQAELWAPSRAAGFVRPGDKVRLMYDAFPYQRFGVGRGSVVEVARAPTAPADLPVPIRTEESLYRVVVDLDDQDMHGYGQDWRLAPGMRLTADMVLEQQSLFAWLFDKVRAAQTRAQPL